jgi:hypothetical protein
MTPHPSSPQPACSVRQRIGLLLGLALLALAVAQPAAGGTYTVTGSCSWVPWSGTAAVHVYPSPDGACPALSIAAEGTGPAGSAGGWTFYAPAGTRIPQLVGI